MTGKSQTYEVPDTGDALTLVAATSSDSKGELTESVTMKIYWRYEVELMRGAA